MVRSGISDKLNNSNIVMEDFRSLYHKIAHSFEGAADLREKLYTEFVGFFNEGDHVIDLGAGDGTWLTLLQNHGVHPIGIDFDAVKVNYLKSLGFEAIQADVVDYIQGLDKSIDGLTMFHIIEHLQPLEVITILHTALTKFTHRGKVLIVTPNFENPIVSGKWFWLDITHVRPYPAELICRILKELGFNTIIQGTSNNHMDTFVFGSLDGEDYGRIVPSILQASRPHFHLHSEI